MPNYAACLITLYNSEIWYLTTMKNLSKQKIVKCVSQSITSLHVLPNPMLSFERIHETNNSATPASILYCKLAIQHFRIFDSNESLFEWCLLKSQLSTNIKTVLFYY